MFHGPGVTAELTWRGWRCRLEIRAQATSPLAGAPLNCELLVQPLDVTGLPAGPVARLASEQVLLQSADSGRTWRGRLWLPAGIDFRLARNCYYRLTRV
jgi:hypothetical protein